LQKDKRTGRKTDRQTKQADFNRKVALGPEEKTSRKTNKQAGRQTDRQNRETKQADFNRKVPLWPEENS